MPGRVPSSAKPISYVRRRDRAVDDDGWIRDFLSRARYGVLATDSDAQPFINPLLFVYDEECRAIYFHTGRGGRVFANIESNDRVCFNAARMGGLIADANPCRFDVEYESVVVFGRARVIDDGPAATRALRLLLRKYLPDPVNAHDREPLTQEMLSNTAVYRLEIEAWSGKRNLSGPPPDAA